MITVHEVETAVRHLTPEELASFRNWFLAYDAEQWDRQIEADVRAGRLDALAVEPQTAEGTLALAAQVYAGLSEQDVDELERIALNRSG